MERTILKNLKFCRIHLQIILLDHQNNFVGILKEPNEPMLQRILIFWHLLHNYFDSSKQGWNDLNQLIKSMI